MQDASQDASQDARAPASCKPGRHPVNKIAAGTNKYKHEKKRRKKKTLRSYTDHTKVGLSLSDII